MGVNYLFGDKNKKLLMDFKNAACYIWVFRNPIPKKVTEIVCYQTQMYDGYDDYIIPFIKDINIMGFKCKYHGTDYDEYGLDKKYHVFTLQVADYKWKHHLTSALTLIRYLFERNHSFLEKYFEVKKEFPRIPALHKLLLANNIEYHGDGHSLYYGSQVKVFNKKELFAKFAETNNTIFEHKKSQLFDIWKTEGKVKKRENETYKNLYKRMKDEKVGFGVFVAGGSAEYANWIPNAKIVKEMKDADLVLFTGGEDVDPSMYGAKMGKHTYSNLNRDQREKIIYDEALAKKIPMLGICRGSQFLCVMNKGKLVQHQENPAAIHEIETSNWGKISITSTHHQAAYPFNLPYYYYQILGWSKDLSKTHLDGDNNELVIDKECEIVYYNGTRCLGIQGHPEFLDYQKKHSKDLEIIKKIFNSFIKNEL